MLTVKYEYYWILSPKLAQAVYVMTWHQVPPLGITYQYVKLKQVPTSLRKAVSYFFAQSSKRIILFKFINFRGAEENENKINSLKTY